MLLAAAWRRLLFAGLAVAAIWASVLWVAPSTPSLGPARPSARVGGATTPGLSSSGTGPLTSIVRSGLAAPGGGHFDRFGVTPQPIAAPVNARGQVAFYATVPRAPGREGIFLADSARISKVAAFGDAVPGGGALAEFAPHSLPALNAAGHVAFGAQIAGGRSTEGIFLATEGELRVIALVGDDAPGVPAGIFAGFEAPSLNDNDELAFVAHVRRGRDVLEVLYFWNGRRLQRLVAEGERLLRIGGTMDKIGEPSINNRGVIAFPAAIFKGPVLGGIFLTGSRELRLLVGAADRTPGGAMILRFSEHLAIDDQDGVVFGAFLRGDGDMREAVLRAGPDGLAEIAVEGAMAPGGGRYVGFGPWPTAAPDGTMAFIAALDGGPGPLAAFVGTGGEIRRAGTMGATLPDGGRIGRFAANAVAAAGPGGMLTVATVAETEGEPDAILCWCPANLAARDRR